MNFNHVIIAGHMTRTAEGRFTKIGKQVAEFSVGINRKWKDSSGVERDEVTFVNCVTFGSAAKALLEHTKRGTPILVQGWLRQESWTDKTTQAKRSRLLLVVETWHFTERRTAAVGEEEAVAETTSSGDERERPS